MRAKSSYANFMIKRHKAFTLIEVLAGLSIFAILLFFAIPFERSLHQKNRIQIVQDEIRGAVRYARAQAIITGNNIILKPLQDSADWSKGIRMFAAANGELIHEWHWNFPGIHVAWQGFQSSHYLLFSADASQNAVNGSFWIESESQRVVKIVLNKLGRIRTLSTAAMNFQHHSQCCASPSSQAVLQR
jgi:prepilin-type N-terminal cleavage/methylation domain-containing protein